VWRCSYSCRESLSCLCGFLQPGVHLHASDCRGWQTGVMSRYRDCLCGTGVVCITFPFSPTCVALVVGWCFRWCCWRRVRAAGMCHPRGHHKSGAYEGGAGKSAAACNSTSDVSRCGCQGFLLQVMCIWTLIPTPWTPDVDTHAWVWVFFCCRLLYGFYGCAPCMGRAGLACICYDAVISALS
jgi:hypothetical protein